MRFAEREVGGLRIHGLMVVHAEAGGIDADQGPQYG